MNTVVPTCAPASFPIPEFGRSAEGLIVARIGDAAYAMLPKADGRHFLGSIWRLSKPLSDWKRSDFYGHGGDVADEAAFRALVQEQAEHQGEKATLGRQEFRAHANTPWGPSQGAVRYGEGVFFHSTSGHGGFHLTVDRNARVHPLLRDASLQDEAQALAQRLAAMPVKALVATRNAMDAAVQMDYGQALAREAAVQSQLGASADYREGVEAFTSKRAPIFTDR